MKYEYARPKCQSGKKPKKLKSKEELPSFLLKIDKTDANSLPQKINFHSPFLGPIFFGACVQHHPFHHSVHLGETHLPIYSSFCRENALNSLFLPKAEKIVKKTETKPIRLFKKGKKVHQNFSEHHCPGFRRIFVPDVRPFMSFGETTSIIEGETSREIPLCRVSGSFSRMSEEDFEIFTLSDIREKQRLLMSHKDRIAHSHFPKEFSTVRIIGPTIPAAITITKLPTKRKRISDIMSTSEVVTKVRKTEVNINEEKEKAKVREEKENKETEYKFEGETKGESFVTIDTDFEDKRSKMEVEPEVCFSEDEEMGIVQEEKVEEVEEKSTELEKMPSEEVKLVESNGNELD